MSKAYIIAYGYIMVKDDIKHTNYGSCRMVNGGSDDECYELIHDLAKHLCELNNIELSNISITFFSIIKESDDG